MSKRPIVLVDLDNVVYPFASVMASVISGSTEVNQSPESLMKLYKSFEIWDDWGIPKGVFDFLWERAIQQGYMWGTEMKVSPISGAQTGLWKLSDAEWHVHIVTSRLNKFRLHDIAVQNTVKWLATWSIPYRSLSFTDDKSFIQGDVIIDDQINHLAEHPAPIKLLYPAPHNESLDRIPDGVQRLTSDPDLSPWDEIVDILT